MLRGRESRFRSVTRGIFQTLSSRHRTHIGEPSRVAKEVTTKMTLLRKSVLAMAVLALALPVTAFGVQINEIRIDDAGPDDDEYIELSGNPGESLDGLYYIVIGDGGVNNALCGNLEFVLDLTGFSIQADGLLSIGQLNPPAPTLTYDTTASLQLENSDNTTHMLVTGLTGNVDDDLDTNDDGVLDITPWSGIVDEVGLDEGTVPNCTSDEYLYTSTTVGPDGNFVPGHVFRCTSGWQIGDFTVGVTDTPGEPNDPICATVSVSLETWGNVKSLFR